MKLVAPLLKELTDEFNKKIKESFISHISLISNVDIILTFSFYKKEKLLISLNHNEPFVSLIETKENFPTLLGHTNDILRKELNGAYIREIKQKENDRVLQFTLQKSNDYFEKLTFYLVLELIPHRSNLIILDENKKIIFATHETTLTSSRIIYKGMTYEELPAIESMISLPYSFKDYKDEANRYLESAKSQRRKDKYSILFTHVKSKIKSLQRKLTILDETSEAAKNNLAYKDMGELCYMIVNDLSLLDEYISSNLLKDYDTSITPEMNASLYFKKYKKAKSTIEHNEIEKEKALSDIEYYERISFQLENGNDDDLDELSLLLKTNKGQKDNHRHKKVKVAPYYIKYNDIRIGFGKTDEQNNILTFEKSHSNYEYFHIENYSGSHVVILSDDPNNDERLVASEIALLLSKKESGDVLTTKIKNVKKGDSLGKVNLKSYTLIHIPKVREETKKLLLTAQKM